MDSDFYLLLLNILLSLRQTAPLDENLRALIAPILKNLQRQYNATVTVHAFINPILKELHAMMLAPGVAEQALKAELQYRHRYGAEQNQTEPTHRKGLPTYHRIDTTEGPELAGILDPNDQIRLGSVTAPMVRLLQMLTDLLEEDISERLEIKEGDKIILIPLRTGDYFRLGHFILWAPGETLAASYEDISKRDSLITFRTILEQLMIRLFANFYQMAADTYLPSYFRVERKHVALLCTEIRGFERISQILRQRHDLSREQAAQCLRKLVNRFSEAAASMVEKNDGRVDQIWGNGLLAIFGQYSITNTNDASSSCIDAAKAAADIVESCDYALKTWLEEDFQSKYYLDVHSEQISLYTVVAIDFGDIMFDYIGSAKNRFYMAVGDHVNFVRQLVSAAGRTEFSIDDYENLLRQIRVIFRDPARPPRRVPPILLSQPAFRGAITTLRPGPEGPANWEYYQRAIRLPGSPIPYSIAEIGPENVLRSISGPFTS